MKVIMRLVVIILIFISLCYYFEIDLFKAANIFTDNNESNITNTGTNIPKSTPVSAVIPDNINLKEVKEKDDENKNYDEIINFLINQRKENKLIESYRIIDKTNITNLKDRSYIADNSLSVIALYNDKDEETKEIALDILKNLASIQNKDGSWYDFYDTSGKVAKVSGKEYLKSYTESNALLLYAYSYYTIMSGNNQFKDTMKKSADYILTKGDSKFDGLYDLDVSTKGSRSLKGNTYAYFGLREYAMSNVFNDYQEYKNKLLAVDKIAVWIIDNLNEKGTFLNGYNGKSKDNSLNIDSQVLGVVLARATKYGDKIKLESKDLDAILSKLYKNFSGMDGYRIDDNVKNNGFIWCEGTCKVPVSFLKLENNERSRNILEFIKKYQEMVPASLTPRGIPYSTNVDKKIDMTNYESVSASAWAAIAFQCNLDSGINSVFFGREEEVFRKIVQE